MHVPRLDVDDADSGSRQFKSEALITGGEGRLGRAVTGVEWDWKLNRERRHIDDAAAVAASHFGKRVADKFQRSEKKRLHL